MINRARKAENKERRIILFAGYCRRKGKNCQFEYFMVRELEDLGKVLRHKLRSLRQTLEKYMIRSLESELLLTLWEDLLISGPLSTT